jgi:RNA polymerase sigma-70 factor (ECF subfamily)
MNDRQVRTPRGRDPIRYVRGIVMTGADKSAEGPVNKGGRFLTTHWTVVRDAGDPKSPDFRAALATLCETYWYPLYAYLRRYGCDPHEAEDLTQGFFARMLDKGDFRLADRERGKFRSFLMAALRNFVANERKHAKRLKRGGAATPVPIDVKDAERHYAKEAVEGLTPEKVFERSWALNVLEQAVDRLRDEWERNQKGRQFDALKEYLTPGKEATTYRTIAESLGMTEGAVKVAVHRLRRAYRAQLRAVIADTVATEEDVEDEIRDLLGAFGD